MNNPLPGGDTEPWYQQFWPWFLILLPASVVVAGLLTLYIANRHADDLVIDDYYKNGLAINRQLEKKQRAKAHGISAHLDFSDLVVNAQISGPVNVAELQLYVSHPLEADRDFEIVLRRIDDGLFRGEMPQPVAPRWHWILQLQSPQGWRLDGAIDATGTGHAGTE